MLSVVFILLGSKIDHKNKNNLYFILFMSFNLGKNLFLETQKSNIWTFFFSATQFKKG